MTFVCDITRNENHICCILINNNSIDKGSDSGINVDGNMSVVAIANRNNDW